LSIVFASLVIMVFVTGVIMAVRAIRGGGSPLTEDEPVPSKIFGPSSLVTTAKEREVQRQWDEYNKSHTKSRAKSVGTAAP
jgi:carbon starvation protein